MQNLDNLNKPIFQRKTILLLNIMLFIIAGIYMYIDPSRFESSYGFSPLLFLYYIPHALFVYSLIIFFRIYFFKNKIISRLETTILLFFMAVSIYMLYNSFGYIYRTPLGEKFIMINPYYQVELSKKTFKVTKIDESYSEEKGYNNEITKKMNFAIHYEVTGKGEYDAFFNNEILLCRKESGGTYDENWNYTPYTYTHGIIKISCQAIPSIPNKLTDCDKRPEGPQRDFCKDSFNYINNMDSITFSINKTISGSNPIEIAEINHILVDKDYFKSE